MQVAEPDVLPWRNQVNPAAGIFPMTPETEQRELGYDILKHGLQQPLVFKGGQLVDGRNRLAAVELEAPPEKRAELMKLMLTGGYDSDLNLSFPPPKLLRDDEDPYEYVVSANYHRRHLSRKDKRAFVDRLLKARPEWSDRAIAKMAMVDHKTAAKVRAKAEANGEIPHNTAAERVETSGRQARGRKPLTHSETPGVVTGSIGSSEKVKPVEPQTENGEQEPPQPAEARLVAMITSAFDDHQLRAFVQQLAGLPTSYSVVDMYRAIEDVRPDLFGNHGEKDHEPDGKSAPAPEPSASTRHDEPEPEIGRKPNLPLESLDTPDTGGMYELWAELAPNPRWYGRQWVAGGCPETYNPDEHFTFKEKMAPFRLAANKASSEQRCLFLQMIASS